jgi:hypothetical protein
MKHLIILFISVVSAGYAAKPTLFEVTRGNTNNKIYIFAGYQDFEGISLADFSSNPADIDRFLAGYIELVEAYKSHKDFFNQRFVSPTFKNKKYAADAFGRIDSGTSLKSILLDTGFYYENKCFLKLQVDGKNTFVNLVDEDGIIKVTNSILRDGAIFTGVKIADESMVADVSIDTSLINLKSVIPLHGISIDSIVSAATNLVPEAPLSSFFIAFNGQFYFEGLDLPLFASAEDKSVDSDLIDPLSKLVEAASLIASDKYDDFVKAWFDEDQAKLEKRFESENFRATYKRNYRTLLDRKLLASVYVGDESIAFYFLDEESEEVDAIFMRKASTEWKLTEQNLLETQNSSSLSSLLGSDEFRNYILLRTYPSKILNEAEVLKAIKMFNIN